MDLIVAFVLLHTLQEGPGSSSPASTAAAPSLAGMSRSDNAQPQASNGHAEPAAAAAAVPEALEGADTAAGADASSAGTSSAPAGLPQTQDELVEVFAALLWDPTCTPSRQHLPHICFAL